MHATLSSSRLSRIVDDLDPGPEIKPPVILLAEDNAELRGLLRQILLRDGNDVIEVCNGGEVIDYLASALLSDSTHPLPDVIVSDIRMPRFNGLDVLRAVAAIDPCTPVVLITAFGDDLLHETAMRAGAHAVIDKPFDTTTLREVVKSALRESAIA